MLILHCIALTTKRWTEITQRIEIDKSNKDTVIKGFEGKNVTKVLNLTFKPMKIQIKFSWYGTDE